MEQYCESIRKIPVKGEYDIIVCGGGPAGVAAALAAARQGASVMLIERNQCCGGIWTSGAMMKYLFLSELVTVMVWSYS